MPGYPVDERPLSQSRPSGGGRRDGCGSAVAGRAQFGRGRLRSMVAPVALPAAGLLYWVGALGALYAAALASYRLLAGFRVWVLGSGAAAVGPALGAWAGECASRPAAPLPRWLFASPPSGAGTGPPGQRDGGLGPAGAGWGALLVGRAGGGRALGGYAVARRSGSGRHPAAGLRQRLKGRRVRQLLRPRPRGVGLRLAAKVAGPEGAGQSGF